ncbi:MAG: hypothetical protein V3V05_13025 [Pontiella sp.]
MKTQLIALLALITACMVANADTSLTAYGTYWEGDDTGNGVGLRLKKTILGFGAIEGRGGQVKFDDTDTDVIPLDLSLNVRLPFMISPYAGVGAGYYLIDSKIPNLENVSGYFGQIGMEATFVWIGVMAEIRWHDIEGSYLDGTSFNLGVLVKW